MSDYPAIPGDRPWSTIDVTGPVSYTVISAATPPTGGQTINASQFSLQTIEFIWATGSDNGQYAVNVFLGKFTAGKGASTAKVQWLTAATGAEVAGTTDLSARSVRLFAIGR